MTSHATSTLSLHEVDHDEQELFGDIVAAVEESLVDVLIEPEQTAELWKELDNMNTGKQFLSGRSQQKRSHTNVTKRVRASMAALQDENSLDQSQLRNYRKSPENHYNLAVKYHEQFVDKVPNLAEDSRLVCEKWRAN